MVGDDVAVANGSTIAINSTSAITAETIRRIPTTPAQRLHPSARHRQAERLASVVSDSTFLRVKEVMAAVGGHDPSHFVRDFKCLFGYTPAQRRERAASQVPGTADPQPEPTRHVAWQTVLKSAGDMRNMFDGRAKLEPLDNDRYPGIR